VQAVREGIAETFEAGWSGVLANALRVSMDVYYQKRHDFVSPLVVETPLLFLDGGDVGRWLASAYIPARVQDLVQREGLTTNAATAQATEEAALYGPSLAGGIGAIPLAVTSSDVAEMENGGADLIATYRNLGDLSLWGGDVALEWLLSRRWTVRGTYSHVSRNWFRIEGSEPLALNAPADKGTLGIAFRDEALGLSAAARVRHTGGFPFLSTDFHGTLCIRDAPDPPGFPEDCIAPRTLLDMTVGYRVPNTGATLQVGVSNLLNTPYRSFVGAPEVGRMAMARIRYDFF
jgi:iron complex outermembrane receptor protein